MTAYLYNRYRKLVEIINNCTVISPSHIEYEKFGQVISREAGEGF